MAKDARGHGSEKRGGGASAERFSGPKDRTRLTPDQVTQLQRQGGFKPFGLGNGGSGIDPRSAFAQTPGGKAKLADQQAAAKLAEGGAPGKNTSVPVHPAQDQGVDFFSKRAQRRENGITRDPDGSGFSFVAHKLSKFER